MAGGRSTPALFELVGRSGGGSRRDPSGAAAPTAGGAPARAAPPGPVSPAKPVVEVKAVAPVAPRVVESRPAPAEGGDGGGERSWARTRGRPAVLDPGRRVSTSMAAVWLGLAGVVVLVIVVWAAAYSLGRDRERGEWVRNLDAGGGPPRDPLVEGLPVNPSLLGTTAAPAAEASGAGGVGVMPDPGTVVEQPAAGSDGRVAGRNYLAVATLDEASAWEAAEFLTANGVKAIAVRRVDRSGSGANNPARFTVYVLEGGGIGSNEFRARQAEREALVAQVGRLGRVWVEEHGGGSDFSRTQWEKYVP